MPKTTAKARKKSQEEVRIEYVPLDEVRRWPRNPKAHALDQIGASFERFGFVDPLVMDERTGRLVGGHGRLDRLEQMRAAGQDPPIRIRAEGDKWLVPVVRGASFKSDSEAEAYLVATNRLVEAGGWDERGLAEIVKGFVEADGMEAGLTGLAFDQEGYDRLMARLPKDPQDVTFKKFDEGSANVVKKATCPKCKHEFPI